jgi:hypothetical protein
MFDQESSYHTGKCLPRSKEDSIITCKCLHCFALSSTQEVFANGI